MTVADEPSLDELTQQAESQPESVDYLALCRYINDDDYDIQSRAKDVRKTVIVGLATPTPAVDGLKPLLDHDDDGVRRAAVETVNRVGRHWPREVVPSIVDELESADVRRRGAAADLLGRFGAGYVRSHLSDLVERLADDDPRVAALALKAIASISESFPEAVAPELRAVGPFLADRWVPEAGGGMQVIYSGTDEKADPATGEPEGSRLTNAVPRPFGSATRSLHRVALTHPEAVEPFVTRILELLGPEEPGRYDARFVRTLFRIARTAPGTVEPALPLLTEYADNAPRGPRVAARNVLRHVGIDVTPSDSVPLPEEMATRDRPIQEGDERLLSGLDERAVFGDIDLDRVVPLFRCADVDQRDHAVWAVGCGAGALNEPVHERGTTFLSLLNEPDDDTRIHLIELLEPVVAAYPEEWTPPLMTLTRHANPVVRSASMALVASTASSFPALVRPDVAPIADRLDDEPLVRKYAFLVLGKLAEAYPDAVASYVPNAVESIDDDSTRLFPFGFIESLARVNPSAAEPAIEPVCQVIETFAGPETIDDRAQWGVGEIDAVEFADMTLKAALEVCVWLAKSDPERLAVIRPHAERVVGRRCWGKDVAQAVIASIDSARSAGVDGT